MEIGGYLEFERYNGKEYHSNCLKLNTARNCLRYLIEARNIKKLWISRWNCSAVLDICKKCNVEVCFFDLDEKFLPVLPDEYNNGEFIYVVNYYGQLKNYYIDNMILDNVQAFFQRPVDNIDTIYTCRKYFGVSDGAYLYTKFYVDRELEQDESTNRITYLSGRLERTGSDFFDEYQKNEIMLDQLPLKVMSRFTENILRSIDYTRIKKQREDNFSFLHEKLMMFNELDLFCPEGPFAYPLKVKYGDRIRRELQKKKIYISKLWPNVGNTYEKSLAENILPLPCDQRYSLEHMEIICDEVINCLTK